MEHKEKDDEMSVDCEIIRGCEADDGFSCDDSINSDGVATKGDCLINGGAATNIDCSINSYDMAINGDGSVIGDATTVGSGLVNVGDDSNRSIDGGMDADNIIDISSDEDDGAVVLSELHTLTQTVVFMITRQIRVVNVITTAEGKYFDN